MFLTSVPGLNLNARLSVMLRSDAEDGAFRHYHSGKGDMGLMAYFGEHWLMKTKHFSGGGYG
jgi:hypothetical protein